MSEKIYKITLADGTVINNLHLNGDNFISREPIDKGVFENNCSPVIINDGYADDRHSHMKLIQITEPFEGEYWFVLCDVSDEELIREVCQAGIQYLAEQTLSDQAANGAFYLFGEWNPNSIPYKKGDRKRVGKILYKCLQDHISQESWSPEDAPSLWVRINDPLVEWPNWVQPVGSTDAYSKGAKVTHNSEHWISDLDNNVWEPGVSCWTKAE